MINDHHYYYYYYYQLFSIPIIIILTIIIIIIITSLISIPPIIIIIIIIIMIIIIIIIITITICNCCHQAPRWEPDRRARAGAVVGAAQRLQGGRAVAIPLRFDCGYPLRAVAYPLF